jgi:hypothetical protein
MLSEIDGIELLTQFPEVEAAFAYGSGMLHEHLCHHSYYDDMAVNLALSDPSI